MSGTYMEESRPGTAGTSRTAVNQESYFSSYGSPLHSISTTFVLSKTESSDLERGGDVPPRASWSYFTSDVDTARCIGPLTAFCFMTGYLDAIAFSAMFLWCGPQTGNTLQLALALARLISGPHPLSFRKSDQLALCSLIAFNLGVFLGRVGDRVGATKRVWQISATFVQALFTMAAAIIIWKSGQPSVANARGDLAWSNGLTFVALAFMSMSLGLQGVQGKRLDAHFGTTIPLTTIWIELMSDPRLFKLRQHIASRDHKFLTIITFFVGAFCGRALTAKLGAATTLGIGAVLRVLISISWIFVPTRIPENH